MTTCLGKSCSFGLPRVPFINCCQFMYLVISLWFWGQDVGSDCISSWSLLIFLRWNELCFASWPGYSDCSCSYTWVSNRRVTQSTFLDGENKQTLKSKRGMLFKLKCGELNNFMKTIHFVWHDVTSYERRFSISLLEKFLYPEKLGKTDYLIRTRACALVSVSDFQPPLVYKSHI